MAEEIEDGNVLGAFHASRALDTLSDALRRVSLEEPNLPKVELWNLQRVAGELNQVLAMVRAARNKRRELHPSPADEVDAADQALASSVDSDSLVPSVDIPLLAGLTVVSR